MKDSKTPVQPKSAINIRADSSRSRKTRTTSDIMTTQEYFVGFPFKSEVLRTRLREKMKNKAIRSEIESTFGKNSSAIYVMPNTSEPKDKSGQDEKRRKAMRRMLVEKYGEDYVKKGCWNLEELSANKKKETSAIKAEVKKSTDLKSMWTPTQHNEIFGILKNSGGKKITQVEESDDKSDHDAHYSEHSNISSEESLESDDLETKQKQKSRSLPKVKEGSASSESAKADDDEVIDVGFEDSRKVHVIMQDEKDSGDCDYINNENVKNQSIQDLNVLNDPSDNLLNEGDINLLDNSTSTNVNNTEDESDLSRAPSKEYIHIPENYEEILEFFAATNLAQHEMKMYRDDPFVTNKFYTINSKYGFPDYLLNRVTIMDNLTEFVNLPVPIGFLVKCRIFRDRRGLDRGMFPTYVMHLENERTQNTLIMTARKRKKTSKSSYLISIDPLNLFRSSKSIVGKVKGNGFGTEYSIYDGGVSPNKLELGMGTNPREELGLIIYEPNLLGFKGPRKLKFFFPMMMSETRRFECHPDGDHDNLSSCAKKKLRHGTMELINKPPIFNGQAGSFVLNFQGRVMQASVKNFQVIHPDKVEYTILQFGRVSEDVFSLDIRYPFCPLQAFGIILSSFSNKLACE